MSPSSPSRAISSKILPGMFSRNSIFVMLINPHHPHCIQDFSSSMKIEEWNYERMKRFYSSAAGCIAWKMKGCHFPNWCLSCTRLARYTKNKMPIDTTLCARPIILVWNRFLKEHTQTELLNFYLFSKEVMHFYLQCAYIQWVPNRLFSINTINPTNHSLQYFVCAKIISSN